MAELSYVATRKDILKLSEVTCEQTPVLYAMLCGQEMRTMDTDIFW